MTKQKTAPKATVYEMVTARIIEALEKGTVPWRKTWNSAGTSSLPKNLVSKKTYRGLNMFVLSMVQGSAGYTSPFWLTFNQARERGGSVRKGEKGTPVFFWKVSESKAGDKDEAGKPLPVGTKRFMARYYTVFNTEQCNDIEIPAAPPVMGPLPDMAPIERCEAVVAGYLKHGPELRHGGAQASYSPIGDTIRMPKAEDFTSRPEYYGTLFHEMTHSTGHEKRLGRFDNTRPPAPFGSADYGREELVAEMGAAFLCAHTGISNETIDNAAAYVAGWLKTIKADPRAAVYAAASAAKAADLVLGDTLAGDEAEGEDEAA